MPVGLECESHVLLQFEASTSPGFGFACRQGGPRLVTTCPVQLLLAHCVAPRRCCRCLSSLRRIVRELSVVRGEMEFEVRCPCPCCSSLAWLRLCCPCGSARLVIACLHVPRCELRSWLGCLVPEKVPEKCFRCVACRLMPRRWSVSRRSSTRWPSTPPRSCRSARASPQASSPCESVRSLLANRFMSAI